MCGVLVRCMHSSLVRALLFAARAALLACVGGLAVMLQRDTIGGTCVTAQTTAGHPKRHTPRRRAGPRARTNNTRTVAHEQGPKQPATTRNTPRARGEAETNKATHTAPNSPECNRIKSMRLHPDTRERSNRSTAPTATTEAPGKPPGTRHATWPQAIPAAHAPHRGALPY